MRNRAKCAKCASIIESLHNTDLILCKCGEISIDGGKNAFVAYAKNWDNFLRVDDEGNEIIVKVIDKTDVPHDSLPTSNDSLPTSEGSLPTLSRDDKIEMLQSMVKSFEELPPQAMFNNINHYDMYNALALVLSIFKS